jgi:hypothetical protein
MDNMVFQPDNGEGAVLCEDQPVRVIQRDLQLVGRARREGWLRDPGVMQKIADRVVKIALTSPDEKLALDAASEVRQMVAQDLKIEADGMPQQVEHRHTHELGPVTADNFAESKRKLAERIARLGGNS